MTTDTDLLDRVAELEQRAQRLVLAGDGRDQGGWGAWHNLLETRLMQERDSERAVLAEVIAALHREFEATAKRIVDEAAARHVRGTYDPKSNYELGDVVALDGGSFMARRATPGPCRGAGWQLIARQGQRGVAGAAGKNTPSIMRWEANIKTFSVTPIMSNGDRGPVLELRELFQEFLRETES
jgi:hypothetical protein